MMHSIKFLKLKIPITFNLFATIDLNSCFGGNIYKCLVCLERRIDFLVHCGHPTTQFLSTTCDHPVDTLVTICVISCLRNCTPIELVAN